MSSPSSPDPSLSPLVQAILKDTPQLTRLFRQSEYRPEHLLATLLHRGQGNAIQILRDLGVDLVDLSLALEARIDAGEETPSGPISSSAEADRIIKASREVAQSLGKPEADTEHLLLALLQIDSLAREVLNEFRLDEPQVRHKLMPVSKSLPQEKSKAHAENPLAERILHSALDLARSAKGRTLPTGPPIDQALYSPGLRETLMLAKAEAARLEHESIAPEHFLLGLIRKNNGLAVELLRKNFADFTHLREALEKELANAPKFSEGRYVQNAEAEKVIAKSGKIAVEMGNRWVGTEHLLLALLAFDWTFPARLIGKTGLSYDAAKKEIQAVVQAPESSSVSGQAPVPAKKSLAESFLPTPGRGIDKTAYTPGMREILKLSKAEAGRLGHSFIETPHYLLGIIRKGDGLAFQTLVQLSIDIPALKIAIEQEIDIGSPMTIGLFSPNPAAKQALERAKGIAAGMNHGWVGSEHLLLALLRDDSILPARLLKEAGADYESVERIILSALARNRKILETHRPVIPPIGIQVGISQSPDAIDIPLPTYATEHAAGVDLRAAVPEAEPMTIEPGQWAIVPTGLKVAIPVGFEGQVRPRSGLAAKHGIGLLNGPGTIDADYRGEIKVIMFNFSKDPFVINRGERIAQLVLSRVTMLQWQPVDELPETPRGEGGFGHTGR